MAKIAHAQAELLETAIAGWKEIELEKIRQNPSAYVVSLAPPQQEMQVVADECGNISEYSTSNPEDMAVASSSVIEEAATISPENTEEMVNAANNLAENTVTENLDSTEVNPSEVGETNNREQA